MNLQEYIEVFGEKEFAKVFKVSPQSVWRYKNFKTAPKITTALKIVQKSRGLVNFNRIYGPYYEKKKKLADLQFQVNK